MSNPTPWRRNAPIRTALVALLVALAALAAGTVAYAVRFDPILPFENDPPPRGTYGEPYSYTIRAVGTAITTTFAIVPGDPALANRPPLGLGLRQINSSSAVIEGTPTIPESAGFIVAVDGLPNEPAGDTDAIDGLAYTGFTIVVDPAPLTVTVDNQSRVYGAANPALTYSVSGLQFNDTAAQVLSGSLATAATSASPVNSYPITQGNLALTPYGAARYTLNVVPGTLNVTRAPLRVVANDATRRVNRPNPDFSASYSGFVNGDDAADLSGTLSLTTTAVLASPAGTYPIVPSGQTSSNYTITFVNGTLTIVNQDVPVITWPAPAAITYGTPLGATQLNATASFGGDPVEGTFTYTPAAGTVLQAGAAQNLQVVFTPTDTLNYAPNTANATITVNRAPLTVTANNATRSAGKPNPTFSASYSGFVNGDDALDLSGTLSLTTTATTASPVGTYPIVPSGQTSSNYTITFTNGTLTVSNFKLYLPSILR